MAEGEGLVSVDYEVSGKVQGVFFRKYTQVRGGVWRGPSSRDARCPLSALRRLLWVPRRGCTVAMAWALAACAWGLSSLSAA